MQKSSKVLNIIIGVLYALLGIIWLISGISSLGNVQILLGTNILTYIVRVTSIIDSICCYWY